MNWRSFFVEGGELPLLNGVPLPNPTHVTAATAVATSLLGGALSLGSPYFAQAVASVLTPLQSTVESFNLSSATAGGGDGTRPADNIGKTASEGLPPFDANE